MAASTSRSFAEQLTEKQTEILRIWEEKARQSIQSAQEQSHPALRDELPMFLQELGKTADLLNATQEIQELKERQLKETAEEHGGQRADLPPFTLDQVLLEYRILRQVLFEVLEKERPLSLSERDAIFDAIQNGMASAALGFLRVQNQREEIARLEAELAVKRLADLQIVTEAALARSTSLDALLHGILGLVRKTFDSDTVAILLLDEDRKHLITTAAQGLDDDVERGVRIPIGQGAAGRILETGKTLFFDDLQRVPHISPSLQNRRIRSLLGSPLRTNGRIIGVMHLGTLGKRDYSQEDARLFGLIADRVALAIDHALLFKQIQEHIDDLNAERNLRARFVSILTHDIRNPLSAALLSAQLLNRREPSPALIKLASRVVLSLQKADSLIQDLLDVNRILSGRPLELDFERFDLRGEIRGILDESAKSQGERFELLADQAVEGYWSRPQIRRLVEGLIATTRSPSSTGHRVPITLETREGSILLRIHADGLPLTPDEQEAVDRPHFGTKEGKIRDGRVLKLTLLRGLAEAHGGSLRIAPRENGSGVLFEIYLPRDSRSVAQEPPKAA